jgi:hypothetical protein
MNNDDEVVNMDEQSKIDQELESEDTIAEDSTELPEDEDSEIDDEADPEPDSEIKEGSD